MKRLFVIAFLLISTFYCFSQPDTSKYYAVSRFDYYTDETAGDILVYIPEAQKGHRISVDLVFEYEFLAKGFPVPSTGIMTVPFPMKTLREGKNEVTVSFYEDEKWVDSRKVWVTVKPCHQNAVKIDRATGGLSVEGLPFFPFGFYSYFPVQPNLPGDEAIKGFNLISPYQVIDKKTLKARKAYMDRCASLGMKVNYNICSVAGGGGVNSSQIQGLTKQEKIERLKKEVEMFRDHPALLAWYIADEPDGQNMPADSLKETYNLIKELDPYHPVSLVLMSPRKAADYRDVTDIAMTDPYPVPQGKIVEVAAYVDLLKKTFMMEKPVWVVPQAFGGNEWWLREPDPREIRAMTYLALIHGATGVQYFIRSSPNNFPKSTAMWDECGAMALELAELTPDINSPYPAPVLIPDNPHIHAKAWNRSGIVTFAVVNDRNEPVPFKLKMDGLDFSIEADVMFENRKVRIAEGALEDIIDAYGTRVYRFDARVRPDRMNGHEPGSLIVDPGFEDLTNAGVPASCYASNTGDPGNTFFIDSRRNFEGEHSLRLNNPSVQPGTNLSFFGIEPQQSRSYTISIMARSGESSNKAGGKKGGPAKFNLSLGSEKRTFECSDEWKKFEINCIRVTGLPEGDSRVSPALEMAGKGTAWFDLLQVYPDMEIKVKMSADGKGRSIELSAIHPEAEIFYTIDGSEPTTASLPYIIPVETSINIFLRAAAFTDGIKVGYIEEKLTH